MNLVVTLYSTVLNLFRISLNFNHVIFTPYFIHPLFKKHTFDEITTIPWMAIYLNLQFGLSKANEIFFLFKKKTYKRERVAIYIPPNKVSPFKDEIKY